MARTSTSKQQSAANVNATAALAAVTRKPMSRPRSRAAAKAAGADHEIKVTAYLQKHYGDRVFRQTKSGRYDLGDVGGVRTPGGKKIALELKNTAKIDLAGWAAEAEKERVNLGAVAGAVISKRHGVGDIGKQWVHLTLDDFVVILTDKRPE